MKTKLLYAALALLPILYTTQNATAQQSKKITFSGEAGINRQTINASGNLIFFQQGAFETGFTAGVNMRVKLGAGFYIEPGLHFTQKGSGGSLPLTLYYAELPVNIIFNPSLANGKLFIGVGGYYAYATGGYHYRGNKIAVTFSDSALYKGLAYPEPIILKHSDAGINVLAGYKITSKLYAKLTGQWGLVNFSPYYRDLRPANNVFKTHGFTFSLGYTF
jgi:hypothetical protein